MTTTMPDSPDSPDTLADRLVSLVEDMALLPYGGELVDQRAHAVQCAMLAAGSRDELIAAALLHDIGYSDTVRTLFPQRPHEESAARYLRPQLGDLVAVLVAAHVSAKRYLVATDAAYAGQLSAASISSLRSQGGAATAQEVATWESLPWWPDAVKLRRLDDQAKVVGIPIAPVKTFRPLLARVARRHLAQPSRHP